MSHNYVYNTPMIYFRIFLTLLFSSCILLVLYNLLHGPKDTDAHAECCNAVIPDVFAHTAYTHYKTACGSCHMAYPPMLLPATAWQELLRAETHFGRDTGISPSRRTELLRFVLQESADASDTRLARRFRSGLKDGTSPPRVTDTAYMLEEHPKIYRELLKNTNNTELQDCRSCHHEAEKGIFCSQQVIIPH